MVSTVSRSSLEENCHDKHVWLFDVSVDLHAPNDPRPKPDSFSQPWWFSKEVIPEGQAQYTD